MDVEVIDAPNGILIDDNYFLSERLFNGIKKFLFVPHFNLSTGMGAHNDIVQEIEIELSKNFDEVRRFANGFYLKSLKKKLRFNGAWFKLVSTK